MRRVCFYSFISYIVIRIGGNKFPFYFDGLRRHFHAFDFGVFLSKDRKPFSCPCSVTLGKSTFHGFSCVSNSSLHFSGQKASVGDRRQRIAGFGLRPPTHAAARRCHRIPVSFRGIV
jgi:hypothetical protein